MEELLEPGTYISLWEQIRLWTMEEVFVPGNGLQVLLTGLTYWMSGFLAKFLRRQMLRLAEKPAFADYIDKGVPLARPIAWLALMWVTNFILGVVEAPGHVVGIVTSLLTAWVVIRLLVRLVRDKVMRRLLAWVAWIIAALNILGLLEPTVEALRAADIPLGSSHVTLYQIIVSTLAMAVLLWAALALGGLLEKRIKSADLSPTLKVLLSKSLKIVLMVVAVMIALDAVGIDLTTLAVFSGAIGLGIGFGLQKIMGNLISGLILLLDKSIKPGDVVAVDDTYGWVNSLGGRYVSVVTRDGTEHLIPNEMLITNKVENWTHSHTRRRLRIPVGVHYKTDVPRAVELCKEAGGRVPRVLKEPAPNCLIRGFGDNSVDLEIRVWIADAHEGVGNVKSAVYAEVWALFLENDIEIPYPQRDLHLRSPEGLIRKLDAIADG